MLPALCYEVQTVRGRSRDLKARQPGPREDAILVLPAGEAGPLWEEALTFHHDLHGGLAVLDAVHHLAAIDPRVIGAQVLDFQGGVAGDGRVVGQRDPVSVGTVNPHLPFSRHQQHQLLLLGNAAPLDSWGEGGGGGGGGHGVHGVDEVAGDGEGAPQEDPQRGRFRDADTQRVVRVCAGDTGVGDRPVSAQSGPPSLPVSASGNDKVPRVCWCLSCAIWNSLSRAAFSRPLVSVPQDRNYGARKGCRGGQGKLQRGDHLSVSETGVPKAMPSHRINRTHLPGVTA